MADLSQAFDLHSYIQQCLSLFYKNFLMLFDLLTFPKADAPAQMWV